MLLSVQTKKNADYKELIVYQKAFNNTLILFGYYKSKKIPWTEKIVIQQLLRALSSIGANIVEGYGRNTKNEYCRFLSIAKGSCLEAEYWINLLIEVTPEDRDTLEKVKLTNVEVIKIITTIIRNLKS